MWMLLGISAGGILGLYDYWTKRATTGNSVLQVVFWSSFFGALAWLPAFTPAGRALGFYVDVSQSSWAEQGLILVKSAAMTASWFFAYYSVRELPMSFSGAVRASGPLWTFAGGMIVFGELLSALQLTAILVSVLAYYVLAVAGKKEGIKVIASGPMLMMLIATILSAMTTVYDKYIVQELDTPLFAIQAHSAIQRCALAALVLWLIRPRGSVSDFQWSLSVPLVGLSWVLAELVYFFAIADPGANVTYLSIFRRTSLVVGFALSVFLIGEKNVKAKTISIGLIVLSTAVLIIDR
ncbi:DMT family transporter [Ensifer sp. ENS05]|uniref:DMT family transporter n=1 Tax=Ensifer sp. ENS05 TaxID=2769277 RepID=UPI0017862A1F|nr:DMT family transporter [Ensifer sp. ENS05]MBD9597770.1 DMT family transporter [Ensifer sp. ENS05]